jgi:hypothetical protein
MSKEMLEDLKYSILSARRFLEREDIVIFFTPPYNESIIEEFEKIATVERRDKHIVRLMKKSRNDEELRAWGDKLYLTEVDCPNVLFLDCDTIVYNDPTPLMEGDFDFGGAHVDWHPRVHKWNLFEKCKQVFNIPNDYKLHCWNAGHLAFKNYAHHKVKDKWIDLIDNREKDLRAFHPNAINDDQVSLIPLFGLHPELKIRVYNKNEIFKIGWHRQSWESGKWSKNIKIFHGDHLVEPLQLKDELDELWGDLTG